MITFPVNLKDVNEVIDFVNLANKVEYLSLIHIFLQMFYGLSDKKLEACMVDVRARRAEKQQRLQKKRTTNKTD